MKLHLPKQLFTALLAAITLATPATLTLGSTAWGVTSVTTDTTWSGGTSSDADKAGITIDGAEAHLKITDGEYKSATEKLELKNAGQLTMSGGTLNTLQIHVHNANASTTETLTLTGGTINVSKENTLADNESAVLIGHWPFGTGKVLVQGGTLNALNGFVTTGWDSHGILEISGTGVVNAKGVALRRYTGSYVKLNGGRLNVGESGIVTHNHTSSNPGNLQFLSGTLGTLSDSGWSLGSNITATIGSIIIDTDVWDATTGATATGDAAGSANISLLGELTAASDSASITLAGSGSLTIDHTWDGTIVKASDTTTAKVLIDTGNMAGFDKVLSGGYGNTQASGFATYQIFKSGSTASVYSTANTDNALSLTDGAYSSSDFHVCDTVNYSDITATVSRFYVQQGGTLTLGALGTTTVNDTTKYYIPAPIHNAGNVTLATSTEGVTTYLNDLFGDAAITQTSTGTTTISGTGAVSMNDAVTLAGKVVISGGSFTNNGKNLNGGTGGTLVLQGVSSATLNGDRKIDVNIEVGNGTTLTLSNTDAFSWSSGSKLTVLTGGTVDLGSTRQSLHQSFTVEMAGGKIQGEGGSQGNYQYGLDFYNGGKIHATENSIINTRVGSNTGNGTITIEVENGKTLTFEGDYAGFSNTTLISKTDTGTLLYKGAAFSNGLTISGGVFEYYVEETRTHSGSISGAGTFKKSGSGTLTLDSANTSVTTLNVAGGKLVYNSSTNTTHTINGASGSTFEKTGSGTLTANTFSLASELLISEGTLKLSSAMESDRRATVADGATLDVNGNAAYYNLTLQEGATLTNTHTEAAPDSTGTGKKQLHTITLEGDAKVTGTSQFGMVGNGWGQATLNLNGNTLTKEGSNIFHLYNTRVQSAGLIQVNGGKVITHGGQGSGTLDLTRASIGIDGGEFELGGNSQSIQDLTLTSGSLTIGSGLTLTALGDVIMAGSKTEDTSTGTVTYTSTVSGNLCLSGTITLNGSVNMSGATLSGTSLAGFTLLTSAKPANSGLNSFTYQLWSGDGSVNSSQSTISVGGVNYKMNAATGTFTTAGTVYYVATGDTITVGGDSAAEGTASATSFVVDGTLSVTADTSTESVIGTAGTVNVAESTTLTLTGMGSSIGTLSATNGTVALAAGSSLYLGQTGADAQETTSSIGTVNVAGASTIHLNEKATLSAISKTGNGSITLNGSGTYTLASGASSLGTGVVLGAANSGWTGTVRISSATDNGRIDLNALGNASSTVALAGVYKWVDKNINVNLLLEAHDVAGEPNGFKISGTSGGGSTYNFNGNISGDGDLIIANGNNDTGYRTFNFNGDLSDWEGNLIIGVSPAANNARDATVNLGTSKKSDIRTIKNFQEEGSIV